MDDEDSKRLFKALKKRRNKQQENTYEWRVHVHKPVDEILDIIRNKNNPEWVKPVPEPYTITSSFETLAEAQEYACMVRLKGKVCSINNNWTGAVVDE